MNNLFFSYMLFAFVLISRPETATAEPEFWRCSANGGLNVLFCFLRANGKDVTYDELMKSQISQREGLAGTALGLCRVSAKYGVPLRITSSTIKQLNACRLPVIVHVDGPNPETGAFLLILKMNGATIAYVNGPSACLHSMSQEDFRRTWNGFALLPVCKGSKYFRECAASFGAGLSLPATVFIIARRFRKRNCEL